MQAARVLFALALFACGSEAGTTTDADEASGSDSRGVSDVIAAKPSAASRDGAADANGPDVPYDRALQKSVHNAYERDEPLLDQLVYHRVRSLELDIHTGKSGESAPARDWFVYHEDNVLMRKTSCTKLSDCLSVLAAFHAATPKHEVVTVWVDLKDPSSIGHTAADLDAAIATGLGRSNVVAPSDLLGACPGATTVRGAVTDACAFPTLAALRGKFIVVTTGGTSCNASSAVAQYGGAAPAARVAFIAPNVDASCPVTSYDARPDVVFFNLSYDERAAATEVASRGLVARIYKGGLAGGIDNANELDIARLAGAVHLATDKVSFDQDSWSRSHGPKGFPFTCVGCDEGLAEAGGIVGLTAASGDQWGTADSAFYALQDGDADARWTALVSVPSSHVEPFGKACLVARASEEPGAANVALCRPLDANPPRMQVRATPGGSTSTRDAPSFPGQSGETSFLLALAVKKLGPASTEVTTSVSRDGKEWAPVGTATIASALPLRGVSLSSHGDGKRRAVFANLRRESGGSSAVVPAAALTAGRAIGSNASGAAFDGPLGP